MRQENAQMYEVLVPCFVSRVAWQSDSICDLFWGGCRRSANLRRHHTCPAVS